MFQSSLKLWSLPSTPSCLQDEEHKVQIHCTAQNPSISCPSTLTKVLFWLCSFSVSLTSSSKPFKFLTRLKTPLFYTHLLLQLQLLLPGLTVDCLNNLLDILCDSTQMSHPLADLILLCDLTVRHTVSVKAHIDGLSDLQTQQKLSFPHCPPCSNSTELPWVTYVSPLCSGTFLSSSLKFLPSLLPPVINLANS